MKTTLFYLPIIICFITGTFATNAIAQDRNFVINIQMDTTYYKTPEYIYMHSFWFNEHLIVDSTYYNGKNPNLAMHGHTDREHEFYLQFEKEGPLSLSIIAKPNDNITIYIASEDDRGGFICKKVLNSASTNEGADFNNKRLDIYRKKQALERQISSNMQDKKKVDLQKDSIRQITDQLRELAVHTLHKTNSPINAYGLFTCPEITSLPKDSFNILLNIAKQKFPNHPEVQCIGISATYPEPSPKSQKDSQRLQQLMLSRIQIKQNPSDRGKGKDPKINDEMSFSLPNNSKEIISLSDINSKYIIVDFWASWCAPCIKEIEMLKKIHQKYKECTICSISIDKNKNDWNNAINRLGMNIFINLIATDQNKNLVPDINKLNIQSIPRNFLLNKEKKIIGIDLSYEELEEKINANMQE